jgi:beta-phosphoglucomutase-like phosphatase (HAD superfamily)/dTDP-glucose pyrophosphorylase
LLENKLVIFDLDGVLIESRELHFKALNSALESIDPKYVISLEDHLSKYDGLPTYKKLQLLHVERGLPVDLFDIISDKKQKETIKFLPDTCGYLKEKTICMFNCLKNKGYKIGVASNAVRHTLRQALYHLGVLQMVDWSVSNEDVKYNKPYPEMYWQIMAATKTLPRNTVIVEDSHIGRQGALDSGAHLVAVENTNDLNNFKIGEIISILEKSQKSSIPWRSSKMNVLVPMAGAGSRFAQAGYTFPKPLIEVRGKPMIQVVVENLNIEAHYIFLVQKEHYEKYNLQYMLNLIAPGCDIVQVDGITDGAACTTLLAKHLIDNDEPLVIANSDQFVEWNSNEVLYAFTADGVDGGILTFESTHPKWSYAKLDSNGFVAEVAEKKVISNHATVGIYYWKRGKDYVNAVCNMMAAGDRVNGEYYVCPAFNHAINIGLKIRIKEVKGMYGLGTPEDLNYFLQNYNNE